MKKAVINYFCQPAGPLNELAKEFPEVSFEVCTSEENLTAVLAGAEILITTPCTVEMLQAAPGLKWIQSLFAGIDSYPLKEIERRGIILTCGRSIATIHIAEYVICALIMLARNFPLFAKNQGIKKWDRSIDQDEINGTTLGILGLGAIGREVAKRAAGMGMKVVAVKRNPEETGFVDELYTPEKMSEVFKKSDYVVNLLPYTPENEKLIDRRYFELMKPTASFINVGRGKTVNEQDLIEALRTKKIKGMVSDVFYEEPLDPSSPLWEMENVFITPHVAGNSIKYLEKSLGVLRHNLRAYLRGKGELLNVVDFERGY
ncbi:MAG: D-2-hydroxyacid dehydrogenase [Peptococcaceae bacterium]|jgi:phosphoglycerate dehydrogenase-like enzyme|nr:D-2-hydroxyacid dehydrogenase [Peptococcaceae bacterium]MDH7525044.1 D-2-hydroxyacid dehydrogenase [Peptococcaceae bacterium]